MRPIALVVLLPVAAFAQPSTPAEPIDAPVPTAATPAARAPSPSAAAIWSLGAGIGYSPRPLGMPYASVYSSLGGVYVSPPQVPAAVASLERRLSARTWLVLGVDGSFSHDRQDLAPDNAGIEKSDLFAVGLTGGVRQLLTRPDAPVDVSVDVVADVGANRWKGDAAYYDYAAGGAIAKASFDASGWRAGATLGLAVDRALTGALSLRVATSLVGAWYSKTRTEISGQPTLDSDELGAGLVVAPRLELRLAF